METIYPLATQTQPHPAGDYQHSNPAAADPIGSFAKYWNYINGVESWETNPWVWVVGFKRIKAT